MIPQFTVHSTLSTHGLSQCTDSSIYDKCRFI